MFLPIIKCFELRTDPGLTMAILELNSFISNLQMVLTESVIVVGCLQSLQTRN